jgi:hypothetical protein
MDRDSCTRSAKRKRRPSIFSVQIDHANGRQVPARLVEYCTRFSDGAEYDYGYRDTDGLTFGPFDHTLKHLAAGLGVFRLVLMWATAQLSFS